MINSRTDLPVFQKFLPCGELATYIQCYWTTTTTRRIESVSITRVLPDGCIELIFNLGDPFYHRSRDTSLPVFPESFVVGTMQVSRSIELTGGIDLFGIRFKPGGAAPFFRVPAHLLTDSVVPFEDLMNERARALGYRIADEPTGIGKIALVEEFLFKQLTDRPCHDTVIQQATRTILETKGQISIKTLETSLMIGRRQLERRFLESVGLSPKVFCRVIRMHGALHMVRHTPKPRWTDIVYTSGFYDQAHFIRECKSLVGLTPSAYLDEHRATRSVPQE